MPDTVADRVYTIEEFEALPDTNGLELVDGRLVENVMGQEAEFIGANLAILLGPFIKAHKLGYLFLSNAGYTLFEGLATRVRKPDVSFVARNRFPDGKFPRGYPRMVPDFAFEAVSPTDIADEVQGKVEDYLRAGVRLVWVAYPQARVVLAFRPTRGYERFAATDTLVAEDLFPGWSAPAAELFPEA